MTRYASRPDGHRDGGGLISSAAARAGAVLMDNPTAVGGTTAFLVALSFVSANALWYQPQLHPSAFVSTRDYVSQVVPAGDVQREVTPPRPHTAPRQDVRAVPVDEEEEVVPVPSNEPTGSVREDTGDDTVRSVQRVLNDLGLYRGPVDGLTGPQTHAAVENYRRIVGLEDGSEIDDALLSQLGLKEAPQQAQSPMEIPELAPKPTPRPASSDAVQTASLKQEPRVAPAAAATGGDETIKRIQAGLRAFGNDDIQIDGVMGENTRLAIREFQSLFGLPVTGEVDGALIAKMREIGLTN